MITLSLINTICGLIYLAAAIFIVVTFEKKNHFKIFITALTITGLWASFNAGQELLYTRATFLDWVITGTQILFTLQNFAWILLLIVLINYAIIQNPQATRSLKAIKYVAVSSTLISLGYTLLWLAPSAIKFAPSSIGLASNLALALVGLILTENLWRNASLDVLWRVKHFCIGVAALFAFDFITIADGLLWQQLDLVFIEIRAIITLLIFPLLFISINRLRTAGSRLQLTRRMTFHSATLVATGLYLLLIGFAGYYIRYFGGSWGGVLQGVFLILTILLLAALLASNTLRAYARNYITGHFFDLKYDYRDEWLRLIDTIADTRDGSDLRLRLIRAIADIMDSPGGVLFQWNDVYQDYRYALDWNFAEIQGKEQANSPLVQNLHHHGVIIHERNGVLGSSSSSFLAYPKAWIIIGLEHRERLLGFIFLRNSRVSRSTDSEDKLLLRIVGRQAAGYLAEYIATQTLAESREIRLFNRRFAFVIHDIKTVIYQMSLLLSNATKHAGNIQFQEDLIISVRESVDSMKKILNQINAERSKKQEASIIDACSMIQHLAEQRKRSGAYIELSVPSDPISISAEETQLNSVFNQLLQNALEVNSNNRSVKLKVRQLNSWAEISIQDYGPGMDERFIREQLFTPLRSTKLTGYGIGMYQVQEIVRELGGQVTVDSLPGHGTTITVVLPLADFTPRNFITPMVAS